MLFSNDLESMSYQEIRKLAKKVGIKANQKAEKLLRSLKDHFESVANDTQCQDECENNVTGESETDTDTERRDRDGGHRVVLRSNPNRHVQVGLPDIETASEDNSSTSSSAYESSEDQKEGKEQKRKRGRNKKVNKLVRPDNKESEVKTPSTVTLEVKSRSTLRQQWPEITVDNKRSITKAIRRSSQRMTTPSGLVRPSGSHKSSLATAVTNSPLDLKSDLAGQKINKRKRGSSSSSEEPGTTWTAAKKRTKVESDPDQDLGYDSKTPVTRRSSRRNTFDKMTPDILPTKESEPDTTGSDIIGLLKDSMSNEEMKECLTSAIDKKVQLQLTQEQAGMTTNTSHIPRFAAFLTKQQAQLKNKKTVTPGNKDWTKIHNKHFNKMDSIDVYLAKKKHRAEVVSASMKKATASTEQAKIAAHKLENMKTPTFSKCAKIVKQVQRGMLFKSPDESRVPFAPTVLSVSKMNLNFSSSLKNGARKTVTPNAAIQPTKSPLHTVQQCENKIKEKKSFDLKASLQKPVTWKMHKGTLKPLEKKSTYQPSTGTGTRERDANLKSHKLQIRDDRREKMKTHQKNKRHDSRMTHRGIHLQNILSD